MNPDDWDVPEKSRQLAIAEIKKRRDTVVSAADDEELRKAKIEAKKALHKAQFARLLKK